MLWASRGGDPLLYVFLHSTRLWWRRVWEGGFEETGCTRLGSVKNVYFLQQMRQVKDKAETRKPAIALLPQIKDRTGQDRTGINLSSRLLMCEGDRETKTFSASQQNSISIHVSKDKETCSERCVCVLIRDLTDHAFMWVLALTLLLCL